MAQPIKKQTWSNLDVFGLINGLSIWDDQYKTLMYVKKPYETNLDVRDNIYRNNDFKTDITKQGLINALHNEFGIEPYNTINKSIFTLTYSPIPSGALDVQDVSGFYKTTSGTWETIGPQIWNENYESAKANKLGFIVWQHNKFSNISGFKNYSYSNLVEVFKEFPDRTELKFEYYVNVVDNNNNVTLLRYTDMNNQTDSDDVRYTYRIQTSGFDLSTDILAYTLNDIPDQIKNIYMDNQGYPTQFYYDIRKYIDNKFNHTWNKITDKSCIWDVHKSYGSGQLNSFYDAIAPENYYKSSIDYTGYLGGVESLSYSLYHNDMLEVSGTNQWYINIYPGRFYIDGIPFYYFENPQSGVLTLGIANSGDFSGFYQASIPSGLERGMYTIAAMSGYYDTYYSNNTKDSLLSGVYEDHSYTTGIDGDKYWSNIYRRRPYLTSRTGAKTNLSYGQYTIDFSGGLIYFSLPPAGYSNVTFIWDNVLTPTGSILAYDLNPINDQNLSFEKFFMSLSLAPNGTYNTLVRS